jgi:hypothetical protein
LKPAEVVGGLGAAAATPAFLAGLLDLLRYGSWSAQSGAAEVVGGLGAAAATPAFVAGLVGLLHDPDVYDRKSAAACLSVFFSLGVRILDGHVRGTSDRGQRKWWTSWIPRLLRRGSSQFRIRWVNDLAQE